MRVRFKKWSIPTLIIIAAGVSSALWLPVIRSDTSNDQSNQASAPPEIRGDRQESNASASDEDRAAKAGDSKRLGMVGRPAPSWGVKRWLNLPAGQKQIDVDDFEGKVTYVLGFQT